MVYISKASNLNNEESIVFNNGSYIGGSIAVGNIPHAIDTDINGNLEGNFVTLSGNVTAMYFVGNDSVLSGISSKIPFQTSNIAIGLYAGNMNQGDYSIAVGYNAAQTNQGPASISTGFNAGKTNQGYSSIAIGVYAGSENQKDYTIAIGDAAGQFEQGRESIAFGENAGQSNQGRFSVAIGTSAAQVQQGNLSVAIGTSAGFTDQNDSTVAIGFRSGMSNQGYNSVAIGSSAGMTNQHYNTIVLNATGSNVNTSDPESFIVAPLRGFQSTAPMLVYNNITKEISYNTSSRKLKKNIIDLTTNTETVYDLRPVEYDVITNDEHHIGLIAEEAYDVDKNFAWTGKDGNPESIIWFNILLYVIAEMKKTRTIFESNIKSLQMQLDDIKASYINLLL